MKQTFPAIILLFVAKSIFCQTSGDSCENRPQIWFQHDDYFDMIEDTVYENEIAPDMLTRWNNHEDWSQALDNMDVYSIHENLFKRDGAPQGMGAKFIQVLADSFGHNNPYADDEWEYEEIVLRTAAKLTELNLHCDFAVMHSDAAGGNGHAFPYYVTPEDIDSTDTPTFSSVLNKVFDFYDEYYCNPGSSDVVGQPEKYSLINYPNPFSETTNIKYQLQKPSHVNITIQDMFGRIMISLIDSEQDAGLYNIAWDGKNSDGISVSAGTYICRLVVNDYVESTTLILMN